MTGGGVGGNSSVIRADRDAIVFVVGGATQNPSTVITATGNSKVLQVYVAVGDPKGGGERGPSNPILSTDRRI